MALSQVGLERLNTATTKKIGTSKNIIVNGACFIAQRGSSSTSAGYQTVDRFKTNYSGVDNNPTQAQGSLSSSDTGPYEAGFRKTFKITNGNQSSGAGAGDAISMSYLIEDQDLATSGWNYLSTTNYVTLSFWFKSSIAQTFYVILESKDGTSRQYSFAITPTGADTWTKVTHTIPGNTGLQFSNDNGEGIEIYFAIFYGTNLTTSGHTLNTWKTTSASDQAPDMTSTWFTTNNATFEITGVQLEVGSLATDFEHRSFADELIKCQRYYYKHSANNNEFFRGMAMADVDNNSIELNSPFPTTMRIAPSAIEQTGNASDYKIRRSTTQTCTAVPSFGHATTDQLQCRFTKSSHGFGDGSAVRCVSGTAGAFIAVSAEL